jgi:uncharacterized alpha-E superfamily protein
MLSRVAESLYWTARSIERAENTSRLLDVSFHGMLDADVSDPEHEWRDLLLAIGRDDLFREHFSDYTAQAVTEFLLWHPANPDAVTACIARARANLREVREQISSELWEHLNRLHILVARWRPARVFAGPHDFFVRIREGSHAFQGVMQAVLPRGEAYEFLELGAYLERADATARLLVARAPGLAGEPTETARTSALLKSCGGFEAFRRQKTDELQAAHAVEFLLLDRNFPRSVLFCAERCLQATRVIAGNSQQAEHVLGRFVAELTFADLPLDGPARDSRLHGFLADVNAVGAEIAAAYFAKRVILPGPYAQQQQ